MKSSGPGVSVVTTTYNERENIQLFVESVGESLKSLEHEIVIGAHNNAITRLR